MKNRCSWVNDNPLMIDYHDNQWGVPLHDDKKLFEFLILDTFQAGLSWEIVLKKRENFRKAFDDFDAQKIINYNESKIAELLLNAGIIRNRLKIYATATNAKAFLQVQEEFGSFDKYIWQFVNYQTIKNNWKNLKEIPVKTKESEDMSKDLRKRGFRFVGPTICYAFMQAAGMVNDHLERCFRYQEIILFNS